MSMTALDAPAGPDASEDPTSPALTTPPVTPRTVESMRVDLLTGAATLTAHWNDLVRAAAEEDRPPVTVAQQQAIARAVAIVHSGITLAEAEPDHLGGVLG